MQIRIVLCRRVFSNSAETGVCPSHGRLYLSKKNYHVGSKGIKGSLTLSEVSQWKQLLKRGTTANTKMDNHYSTPSLVAFGIPTTDFSFLVSDKSIIEKYELNVDSQREISYDLLDMLKNECREKKFQFKKTAGGNCQVSLMVYQNLNQERYQTVMCGAVGDDDNGLFVHKYLTNKFIRTDFDVIENTKTASCVVAVHKDLRTIAVTNGAGSEYSVQHCANLNQKIDLATSATVVLFEGFFVGFSYDIAVPILQRCRQSGTVVALNISGGYIIQHFPHEFMFCWRKSDVLIGNMSEFDTLCEVLRLPPRPVHERLKLVQKMMLAEKTVCSSKLPAMKLWRKILIVTNNKEPVYCVYGNNTLVEFPVPRIPEADIVDTCGAGDSFLGGFLYGLIEQKPIETCLEIGCMISSKIVQRHGYDL